jgi:hypothetical protein
MPVLSDCSRLREQFRKQNYDIRIVEEMRGTVFNDIVQQGCTHDLRWDRR